MIIDHIETTDIHKGNRAMKAAMEFLKGLTPETPEGEYEIDGRAVFARLMRYETKERGEGRMESHRKYADIQVLLSGREAVEWSPRGMLDEAPYDEGNDVCFHPVPPESSGRFVLVPGLFALFMPHDAHMPMLNPGGSDNSTEDNPEDNPDDNPDNNPDDNTCARTVTKVVVKVEAALLDAAAPQDV